MEAKPNPANTADKGVAARKRIPMSVPRRRLEVPDLAGYHLHWFVDRNVPAALQAHYEFVDERDIPLNQRGIANDTSVSGNADLGSHMRVIAGVAEGGGVEHLTLMKLREDLWTEDQQVIEARNAEILRSIFREEQIMGSDKMSREDKNLSYVGTALFQRPARKGK